MTTRHKWPFVSRVDHSSPVVVSEDAPGNDAFASFDDGDWAMPEPKTFAEIDAEADRLVQEVMRQPLSKGEAS